jgi:hypothetical protein
MSAATLALAALELIKLHFLASWAFLALGEPFPYLGASIAFAAALLVSAAVRRRGARVIFYVLAEFAVFAIAFAALWASWTGRFAAIFKPAELLPRGGSETVAFFVMLGAVALYCLRAAWLEAKSGPREFCVARFDEGTAVFLAGLAIAALVRVENPVPARLTLPYYLAGILALGLSAGGRAAKGRLAAPTRAPALAGAAVAFAVAAIGVILLVPTLTEPARRAAVAMKDASGELLRLLVIFLDWLFRNSRRQPRFADNPAATEAPPERAPGDPEQKYSAVLMWIVLGLVGIAVLAIVAALLVYLFRILAGRTKKPGGGTSAPGRRHFLRELAAAWARLLARLKQAAGARRFRLRLSPVAQAYLSLVAAARAVGLRRAPAETAREFAQRVAAAYPESAGGAPGLVRDLEAEVYGRHVTRARESAEKPHALPRFSARSFLAERLARLARRP